ncbi:MAG TPA: hypothetical protein VFR03_11130, partial [Thermoanaerobaculia bacterium]|nr:hypothetical protein [Thermoanaerobaculia bacterium]
ATAGRHTLFGRVERQENDELLGHGEGPVFTVGKLSVGYIYDFFHQENLRTGVGAVGSVARIPGDLRARYGRARPLSWMGFLRVRI